MKALDLKVKVAELENKVLRIEAVIKARDFDVNKVKAIKAILQGE